MKITVTGSAGFIGQHLVAELKKRGHEVEEFDIAGGYDVTNRWQVDAAVKGKDMVFHLAGLLGTHELVDNAIEAVKVNVIGTLNVLNACAKHKVKLLEVSKPNCWVNTYTITKVAAESFTEMYRREHGLEAITVKWFNVYGEGQLLNHEVGYKKFIPTAIVAGLKGDDIEVYGDGTQTVDLVHTDDTVNATLSLVENWKECEGGVYEIGAEEWVLNDVADMIQEMTGGKSKIVHIPMRKGETAKTRIKADLTNIQKVWKPKVKLKEGLERTIKAYSQRYASYIAGTE